MTGNNKTRKGRAQLIAERITSMKSGRNGQAKEIKNPFQPAGVFSDDFIETLHEKALEILECYGIRILLPEAVKLFKKNGARVASDGQMVFIGKEIVSSAIASAPKQYTVKAGAQNRDVVMQLGNLVFQPGAGAAYTTDRLRGRRVGREEDFRELVQLTHHFDSLHMIPPLVEPQDIPTQFRHYSLLEAKLILSDKVPHIFSRGTPQVSESFEMLQNFRGLSDQEFKDNAYSYTVINTNSPRQIDAPMAQGVIDFARFGQLAIITPFTLMGAMAPITVAGAITLSHAEALATISLSQLSRAGAPVCYGTFTSNVDMKTGAPAFGTPEHFRASLAAGQLARYLGLPWRCASGSASNVNDAQAANETQFGAWGCLLAGATVIIHAAGWLEGGLTVGYEKLINDMEFIQMITNLCQNYPEKIEDIGMEAIESVPPGGHFFDSPHTMSRYKDEFYTHLVGDLSNYGTWKENGALDSDARATKIWKSILKENNRPFQSQCKVEELQEFIRRRTAAGGAPPVS